MVKPKTKFETDKQLTFDESVKKINEVLAKIKNLDEDEGGDPKE